MRIIISTALAMLVFAACTSKKEVAPTTEKEKGNWQSEMLAIQLVSYKSGKETIKTGNAEITLTLEKTALGYSGKSACNRYFGQFELVSASRVNFKVGGSTEMMCEENLMQWEVRYFNALINHTYDIIEGDEEVIFKEVDGDIKLVWRKFEVYE